MDPLAAAASRVVGYLVPYALEKTVDLATKIGKSTVDKIGGWFDGLRARWAGDEKASEVLAEFEDAPEANADRLRDVLAERMASDPTLVESAEQLAKDVGPTVVVTMRAGEVVVQNGPTFGDVLRGNVNVGMILDKGDTQQGPRFGDIG